MKILEDQIAAAIGAHGLWKGRLKAAIASGTSDMPIDVVRDDHQCNFGKWLHGPELGAAEKNSPHYQTCMQLHRRFHLAAAEILSLAIAGKKNEASEALGKGHNFAAISVELTKAMVSWKGN